MFAALGLALCPLVRAAANNPERWQLVANSAYPAGPGRWIRSSSPGAAASPALRTISGNLPEPRSASPFVVRAGERVVLDEDRGRVSFSLVGRALGSARAGEPLRVQMLGLNAPVMTVVALSPGRVGFAAQQGGAR
jgi:hypothetical protein